MKTKLEYLVVFISAKENTKEKLTHLGLLGWELCGVVPSINQDSTMSSAWPDVVQYIFKRPAK